MTVQETVTEIAPITLTETREQTLLQTVVQTSSIYVSSQKADALNYSSGLQLELALNTSVIFEQPRDENESGALLVSMSLFNTLGKNNNLSATQNWPLPDLSSGACSSYDQPFGIDVMYGYYTISNVTSASPLPLFTPSFCPVYFPPAFFVFDPNSDYINTVSIPRTSIQLVTNSTVTLTRTSILEYTTPQGNDQREIPLSGYCCTVTRQENCLCYTYGLIPFEVGTYTIADGDEWGDLVLMHFIVMP